MEIVSQSDIKYSLEDEKRRKKNAVTSRLRALSVGSKERPNLEEVKEQPSPTARESSSENLSMRHKKTRSKDKMQDVSNKDDSAKQSENATSDPPSKSRRKSKRSKVQQQWKSLDKEQRIEFTKRILDDPEGLSFLLQFLASEDLESRHLSLWMEIRNYKHHSSRLAARLALSKKIYDKFLVKNAPNYVKLSKIETEEVVIRVSSSSELENSSPLGETLLLKPDILEQIQQDLLRHISKHSIPKFIKSELYQTYISSEQYVEISL